MQKTSKSVFDELDRGVRAILPDLGLHTPTRAQDLGIPLIMKRRNVLLVAPTASGKTEAALLPALSHYLRRRQRRSIAIIYVTPLRALNRDLLNRITQITTKLGIICQIRHGDTSISERRTQERNPPQVLITTPETLQAILPSASMRRHLKSVSTVIIDEIHELAQDKRGAQLTIGLERLREITKTRFQRIGLSATVGDPEEVANFLVGPTEDCRIVLADIERETKYHVEYPHPTPEDHDLAQTLYTSADAAARISRIKELIDTHTSTLIFVNSRQHAEMLGLRLGKLAERIAVHHGSLSREERARIEAQFKLGQLSGIVCTSTLELGIDIGAVDLAVQYLSPRQVSSLIQRVGRSGHRVGRTSEGILICAYPEDVLESIAIIKRAEARQLESMQIHANALDVLAHQVAGIIMDTEGSSPRKILSIVRRSGPFSNLEREQFQSVLGYMKTVRLIGGSGTVLRRTPRTRHYYYQNLSMIPDERRYTIVDLTTQTNVGTLGEEFVLLRARRGIHFICRGRVWEITSLGEDERIYVVPVEDPTAAIPGWDGEILPVPMDVAHEVGALRREIEIHLKTKGKDRTLELLCKRYPIERLAAQRIMDEIGDYVKRGHPVPTDRLILSEGFDRYLIVHACLGEAINRTFAHVFDQILSEHAEISNVWADGYRILIEFQEPLSEDTVHSKSKQLFSISEEMMETRFNEYVQRRHPFSYKMKSIAERFGAIPRGLFLTERTLSDLSARLEHTPIQEETLREAKLTSVDVQGTKRTLHRIAEGALVVTVVVSEGTPTPNAFHMLNKFVELPEMAAPESTRKDNLARMKTALLAQRVELLCLNCGSATPEQRAEQISDFPKCSTCGSGLLALRTKVRADVAGIIQKWKSRQELREDERKALSQARRTADLILSYGRQAVVALLTWGVGPQTAASILARMHTDEQDFYADLLKAKLKYIQTRPFWDRT